jgi:hypothetical protein
MFGVLLMLVGVQLVSTGLLGEMISSTQVGQKAHYEIRAERLPESPSAPIELPAEKARQPVMSA